MSRPSVRSARLAGWIAVPVALVISGGAIAGSSYSAFSATTGNATNAWAMGDVNLSDDDSGTAMFTTSNAANLAPGSSATKCVVVTSHGSLASKIRLYTTDATSTKDLASYVTVTIKIGTGGSFNDCTGFSSTDTIYSGTLASIATAAGDYAHGLGEWTAAKDDARTYQFTTTVDSDVPNTAQGGTAGIGFTWEAQN
jgi:hypothetical protein